MFILKRLMINIVKLYYKIERSEIFFEKDSVTDNFNSKKRNYISLNVF